MELRELIEQGENAAGGRKELAKLLLVHAQQITDAKSGRNGLPISACYVLAELIHEDARCVIAASELVTEKKPERRAVLLPFARHAAIIAITAGVNLLLTPAPTNANTGTPSSGPTIGIM
ncbi:hypothetical protein GPA22_17705 [Aromatoleum toluvorans]|uniref:Uncharacterized protein n=1 Tax=Aromatoleum toluvorans TaxID=92002 RepID=A0ABX1Q1M9_9RHOO|nr:hypothetical protein [Aromatoleum toluvorans]NMG45553.1 hypothetical protein [Aromatoleum toluvorans]